MPCYIVIQHPNIHLRACPEFFEYKYSTTFKEIEFDSPGGFEGSVNEKNILEKQYSRNDALTNVFNKVQYINEVGGAEAR